MVSKSFCSACKHPLSKSSNLISTFDKLTQTAYLTEDGYLFRNPYWHMGMLPAPEYMQELLDDLNKEVVPTPKGSFLEYSTQYFNLYQFPFIWFSPTQTILCRLPYAGRNWFEQATFFLPPTNEVEPDFNDLMMRIEARWTVAGYAFNGEKQKWERKRAIFRNEVKPADYILKPKEEILSENNDGSRWVKTAHYYEGPDQEEPSIEELRFLKTSSEKLKEWVEEYVNKRMEQRTIYTPGFVEKTKQFLKDYSPGGEWTQTGKLKIPDYQAIRILMLAEGSQLIRNIERKIDKTRKGYELYTMVGSPIKVNDERMLIRLERDFIAEWWPRAYNLEGLWQFSARPLTKKMIEDWENGRPLQSCVFCPSEAGMASTRSDDFVFDSKDLLRHDQAEANDEWKEVIAKSTAGYLASEARKFNQGIIEEGGPMLSDAKTLKNMHASALTGRIELMENALKSTDDRSTKETFKSYTQILGGELGRRKDELKATELNRDKIEAEQKELEEQKTRYENFIEQHQQEQEKIRKQTKEWEEDKKKKENELEEKTRRYSERKEEKQRTKNEIDRIGGQIKENKNRLDNRLSDLTRDEIKDLNDEQERLRKETEELRKKLGEHDVELGKINNEIEITKDQIRLLDDNIHRNHTNILHHDADISALRDKLNELGERLRDKEGEIDVLRDKIDGMNRPGYLSPRDRDPSGGGGSGSQSQPRVNPGSFYVKYTVISSAGRLLGVKTVTLDTLTYAESWANQVRKEHWKPGAGGLTQGKREYIYKEIMEYVRRCKNGENIKIDDGGEYLG